jgi:hypothetical protein
MRRAVPPPKAAPTLHTGRPPATMQRSNRTVTAVRVSTPTECQWQPKRRACVPEVPSESTATALLPHRPRSTPPTCHPDMPRALGAEPTDPTLLGRTRKRHWQEGGTHR